jgi:hypothetical protein
VDYGNSNPIGGREVAIGNYSELEVYRMMVDKILLMDESVEIKSQLLADAVPNISYLISHLSLLKSKGVVSYEEYTQLSSKCLLKVNKSSSSYDPLFLQE